MPRPLRWTDDELRAAVAASHSFKEICDRLGIGPGGGTYRSLRRHIARLGLDAGHLSALVPGATRTRRSWTDDGLRAAVQASESIAGVLRTLGTNPAAGCTATSARTSAGSNSTRATSPGRRARGAGACRLAGPARCTKSS